jgi:Zn-dependent protease with chaperone function
MAPPVAYDPINAGDIQFLRGRAQAVLRDLVAALAGGQQQRVQNIPLVVDDEPGEVNAFAACTREGKALMAISDGLLDIEAHLAQAAATDELFGTRKVDEYIRFLAANQRPQQPIVRPPRGFFDPVQAADGRKVRRQHQLLDEQIAFVMGHELAHHYLGHLPCTSGNTITAADVGRVLSSAVPVFNQPNELAADVAGTSNVLTAGSRRQDFRWNEEGGLLTMRFFSALDAFTPSDILFGFERTHPPPQLRTPVIQQAANTWRATGGNIPMFGF